MCDYNSYGTSELISAGKLGIGDGFRAKNSELSAAGLPFLRAANLNNGFDFSGADHIPQSLAMKLGAKLSQPGDSVFTSKGTVGRLGFVRQDTPQFVYSPQLCYWRSLDHEFLRPRFLYFWMNSEEFTSQWRKVADQTDMAPYVSLNDQRRMNITIPPTSVQDGIVDVLGAIDDMIDHNLKMNSTLGQMRDTLLPELFAGRLGVADAKKLTEEAV